MFRFCMVMIAVLSQSLSAAPVTVTVNSEDGQPVYGSVVVLMPQDGVSETERNLSAHRTPAVMNQIDKQFVPHILAVQTHSQVTFPNSDNIFHHVYSFSPAKQFEVKLYKEFEVDPVTFDEPGIVDLGCNIHDWMLGYIYITDSPYFSRTDKDGTAVIDVPDGPYTIRVWHPRLHDSDIARRHEVSVSAAQTVPVILRHQMSPKTDYEEGFEEY